MPQSVKGVRRRGFALRCATAALAFAATCVQAQDRPLWEAGAGVTVLSFPDYRGSNERRPWVLPFPYLIYRGDFLKADEQRGVRGLLAKADRLELDASFNATVPVKSSSNEARQGMPDLDPTVEVGPSLNVMLARSGRGTELELRLPVRAVVATDLRHAQFAGWVFAPTLNVDVVDAFGSPGLRFGALAGPMYSDRRHNEYFYRVDPAFATPDRPAYSPGGGYAGAQFILALSKRFGEFWVGGFARWDTLRNAAFEASPLVKTEQYFAAGIALAWVLGKSNTMVDGNR